MKPTEQIERLRHGVVDVISEAELLDRLAEGRPLRVKFGADPSAPDLHLGHFVVLKKLRQFQDLGHSVLFLIGDFTGMIGDPTGRSESRKALGRDEVVANARTYQEQVFLVLDPDRTEIRFNSEWMDRCSASDLIRLASQWTVARMLERDDFSKRFRTQLPISLHEFLYPLIQGYDSVALGCDIEVGGTDQRFNLLVGRELQRASGQKPQIVLTLPLLEGLEGQLKMSKSLGNSIGITEPPASMFGKLMSISDGLMIRYYDLLTDDNGARIESLIEQGRLHPMTAKKRLAATITAQFHGLGAALGARQAFEDQFQRREIPLDAAEIVWPHPEHEIGIVRLLHECGLVSSMSEGRRMIAQGAVKLDGMRISDHATKVLLQADAPHVLQVGTRKIARVRI